MSRSRAWPAHRVRICQSLSFIAGERLVRSVSRFIELKPRGCAHPQVFTRGKTKKGLEWKYWQYYQLRVQALNGFSRRNVCAHARSARMRRVGQFSTPAVGKYAPTFQNRDRSTRCEQYSLPLLDQCRDSHSLRDSRNACFESLRPD